MQTPEPIDGYVSACCGAEHDIDAGDICIDNETIMGGCSRCYKYAEFIPTEEWTQTMRVRQAAGIAELNSFVPDGTDYHMDLW
jgi:hypothetical protein